MASLAQKGLAAVSARNYTEAVSYLDKAIATSPSPVWLLARAQAHQQLKNYEGALRDAELAWHVAAERGSDASRKQMIDAQYRRAVILFQMGRYADSDCCARWSQLMCERRSVLEDDDVKRQVDKDGFYTVSVEAVKESRGPFGPGGATSQRKSFADVMGMTVNSTNITDKSAWNRAYMWRMQSLGQMEKLPAGDPGRKVSVDKVPARPVWQKQQIEERIEEKKQKGKEKDAVAVELREEKLMQKPDLVPDDKMKVRADFYQTDKSVHLSLYVKNVDAAKLKLDFQTTTVALGPIPREAAPHVKPGDREAYSVLALAGDIIPEASRCSVSPRKIDLVLQKAAPGQKWYSWGREVVSANMETLRGSTTSISTSSPHNAGEAPAKPTTHTKAASVAGKQQAQGSASKPSISSEPAYPNSSKSGPKNWDKLLEALDDKEPEDVDSFFKDLFQNSTEDQKRAMMKSFVESNGTALSTDWSDVKNRTVEMVPPDGVEPRKWED